MLAYAGKNRDIDLLRAKITCIGSIYREYIWGTRMGLKKT